MLFRSAPSYAPVYYDPTYQPSTAPVVGPSLAPSYAPSSGPSYAPVYYDPTYQPSAAPVVGPSLAPSYAPVYYDPTYQPSAAPVVGPSIAPSYAPVYYDPTYQPSAAPVVVPSLAPSYAPSFEPSSLPSAIMSPNLNSTSAPIVTAIKILKSGNSSLDLVATLEWRPLFESSTVIVYCVALRNGSSPSSIGAVESASIKGSIDKGSSTAIPSNSAYPLNASMAISDLDALQKYAIYCYAETSSGSGNSLKAVIATKVSATTACCKSITFTNAPPFVYSNESRYSESSRSLFVFAYTLSSPPIGVLQVTPLFFSDGLDNRIIATPASTTFSNTSPLIGRFYLSTSSAIATSIRIILKLNGTNPLHYRASSTSVQLLSESSSALAPKMVSSRFSNGGEYFLITFDSLTDKAGFTNTSWSCNTLFTFSSADKSTCTWLNAAVVKATFPAMNETTSSLNFAKVGDVVTVKDSKVRAFCTETSLLCAQNPSASNSVVMQAPLSPTAPTVVITAPQKIGLCSDLVLDATGSYGHGARLYSSAVWTVSAVAADPQDEFSTSDLGVYLNFLSSSSQVQQPFIIPRNQLAAATYSFTLRLVNFLDISSVSTVDVVVTSNSTVPLLTIIGPHYRTIFASSRLSILCTGSSSPCDSADLVSYKWNVKLDGVSSETTSASADPLVFSALPYTLTVDKTYNITVTAFTSKSSSSSSVLVYVSRGDVTAAVEGGYSWSIPVNQSLVLNALISTDADVPVNSESTLKYKVCSQTLHSFTTC